MLSILLRWIAAAALALITIGAFVRFALTGQTLQACMALGAGTLLVALVGPDDDERERLIKFLAALPFEEDGA